MKDAEELGRLFPAVYLRLHARRPKRGHRPPADAMAVLQHLAISGPLTVGEAARHFERAQSAERRALLDGMRALIEAADRVAKQRRRT